VRQPKGWLLTKNICTSSFLSELPFPLVLKLPESSFSQGVFRVNNTEELEEKLKLMFKESALVIAQEFLESDYDWRIGMMDNTPLFACKYYMANGHWQIYNWDHNEQDEFSGKHETVPVAQVNSEILKAAIKATTLIGNGFYGVDIKEVKGKAYVIEVNDNPNIDVGVEDLLLGDDLYIRIMQSIYNRIEAERMQTRSLI
jgi:glutathione synthase/RimK-type ligase-like ATP-grasp enzyme